MNKDDLDEKRWFDSLKRKFTKYINSPYWDDLNLPESYMDIIVQIMKAKNVNELSPLINERLTDAIIETIQKRTKERKRKSKEITK